MYRGTTPQIKFTFPEDIVLSAMSEIWVTIKCLSVMKTYKMSEKQISVEDQTVVLKLSQEDTLGFTSGMAKIQIRMLTKNNESLCTSIKEIRINDILENGVIS